MFFELRYDHSDEFITKVEINSFTQLYSFFKDHEITINFDEQIIWVKSKNEKFTLCPYLP